ncbi:hypothetical protein E4T38_01900 [Aureobasidium subglaciale]|nr:hypothetical protein E4T38_01900 [Aureobasidium subglaciale]KAI5229419.1 hypothetical protein E4T40_01580 [Aureobasidium subglaciale]KAI5232861.1 hypothetical protein E4T41_01898 [Aureobasidium subglaciale]KAI5266431.1 hypothetical protein E4T46_01577 [Aureobasidium subglaciale]
MGVSVEKRNATFGWKVYAALLILTSVGHACLVPHIRPLRDALTQPLWILRNDISTSVTDFVVVLVVGLYFHGADDLKLPAWILKTRLVELQVFACLVLLMIFARLIVWRGEVQSEQWKAEAKDESSTEQFLPPLLIPGRTTHSRMFPQKHSFAYSYFSVGVPVNFKGCAGSMLSTNLELLPPGQRRKGWFNVNAADYLYRGGSERGLEERLRCYLRGEGVPDEAWSFAYLVTAPKFLGYSFNPVSFWYIYDSSRRLTMMVLEVNNTFGERRLYLLKAEEKATNDSVPDGFEAPAKATKFTNAWVKDFHVSPFNSRKGTYSLTAADPVAALKSGSKVLDNVVVLNSSKAHAKLVARVYSEDYMDPMAMTTGQIVRLLSSWFWVGFLTFPRIVTQAYKLYFKRKLHVWFRPEVLASSMGRTHTSSEAVVEGFFRAYLGYLVDNASESLRLTYTPAGGLGASITLTSKNAEDNKEAKELALKVISPAFYTRFAHYSHTTEAFDRESLHTDPKNRTLIIENAKNLSILLATASPQAVKSELGKVQQWRWSLLQHLRSPPPAAAYPDTNTEIPDRASVQDIRKMPLSPLDKFAVSLPTNKGKEYTEVIMAQLAKNVSPAHKLGSENLGTFYRDTVTRILFADTYLLGFEGLIRVLDFMVRAGLVVVWFKFFAGGEVGKTRLLFEDGKAWKVLGWKIGYWVMANGLHLWAAVKGA